MKVKTNQISLCILIFSAVLLAVSWAQVSGDEEFNDAENNQTDIINPGPGQESQASENDSWWEQRADTNKDGSVDPEELSAWKGLEREHLDSNNDGRIDEIEKRLSWKSLQSPINTELEQNFDADNNGWLEPEEARKLLFRRVEFIFQTNGKGAIKTGLEKLYDTNSDGVIDLEEIKALREDLKSNE